LDLGEHGGAEVPVKLLAACAKIKTDRIMPWLGCYIGLLLGRHTFKLAERYYGGCKHALY
jgi:hypothetical protein